MEISTSVLVNNSLVAINSVPRGSRAWHKANSVFCPVGPAPTQAFILLIKQDLDQLDVNGQHKITFIQQTIGDADEEGNTPAPTITRIDFPGLWFVDAERLTFGGEGDSSGLYLVEFQDSRRIANKHSESGDIRANLLIKPPRNDAPSNYLTGTKLNNWDDLLEQVWNKCLFLGEYPGIPSDLPIDGVPTEQHYIGNNAYKVLNSVLDVLDCALRHNPLTNVYDIVQLGGDGDSDYPNNPILKWNGEPETSQADNVAKNVKVYHPVLYQMGLESDTEYSNNWSTGFVDPTLMPTGVTGAAGTVALWDDLPKIYNEQNGVSNSNELNTRDQNRVIRYAARWSVSKEHKIYIGWLNDIQPGATIRAVIWRNWDDLDSAFGGSVTEYLAGPELIKSFDYDSYCPEYEAFEPYDFNRHSFPTWPRLPNLVQVWHDSTDAGTVVQPDGRIGTSQIQVHSGRVVRWTAGSMLKLDRCWILFADDFDTKQGSIQAKQGDYIGPARLSGSATGTFFLDPEQEDFLWPIYVIAKGTDTEEIVIFQLTQALSLNVGSTASATTCSLDGSGNWVTTNGTAITVIDGLSSVFGRWSGPVGAKGIAKKRSDGKYEIIEMQRNALIVEFTVYANRTRGDESFLVTVDNQYQQGDLKVSQGQAGNPLTVYDSNQFFPRVATGAKGRAIWNDKANRYDVLDVQQICIRARASFDGTQAQDGMVGDIQNEPIKDFVSTDPSPFNTAPNPKPSQALNRLGLRAADGDDLLIEWDDDTRDWVIVGTSNNERGYIVKPQSTVTKGQAVTCEIIFGSAPSRTLQCIAEGDGVTKGKLCSTWRDPTSGQNYVAPWEP